MPIYATTRKPPALDGARLRSRFGSPARGFSVPSRTEDAQDPEVALERAERFGHNLGGFRVASEARSGSSPSGPNPAAAPIQRVVRPGRGSNSGKYHSSETGKWYDSREEAETEDRKAAAERLLQKQQEAEQRKKLKEERLKLDITPKDAKFPLDQMVQVAHNRPRDPKYARHSTTAVGIPITYEGFGTPVISQQRNDENTVKELREKLTKSKFELPDPEVITSLESGQHADPFAMYKAFVGDFEETGELPTSVLFGVSKGRCDDCDDALQDFPVIMDESFILGESTKQWEHGKRTDVDDDMISDE